MKHCYKCGRSKPLAQFYDHPKNADGKLGKCKTCCKRLENIRRARLSRDQAWLDFERARSRDKIAKARANGVAKAVPKLARVASVKKWQTRNPEKRKAHNAANNAQRDGKLTPPEFCERCREPGKLQKHHENYTKHLEVVWLCSKCHGIQRRKTGLPISRKKI